MAALAFAICTFYPMIPAGFEDVLKEYPPALKSLFGIDDLLSPAGFLKAELFSLMVPLLVLVFAVGRGAAAIAGEEERRTMDVLLALPVRRRRVVLEKGAGLAIEVVALSAALFVGLVLGSLVAGMDIPIANLAAASAATAALGLAFGGLAIAIGAATGSRGLAVGASSGVGAVTYLSNGLADLVDWLEPLQPASPFYLYFDRNPLTEGLGWGALVLALAAVALAGAAAWGFERRDVRA